MFHLNFWPTRPFTSPGVASSANGSTPGGTSDFLSLQFPPSPTLMVLASEDNDAASAATSTRTTDGVVDGKRQHHHHHHHHLPHRSPQSPEKSVGRHPLPGGGGPFGSAGPFPLFRSGVESFLGPGAAALFHPPTTTFDASSFHRAAAAAAAALDQRRIHGALFGYPSGPAGYPLHQPSAFQPAAKSRASKTSENSYRLRLQSRGDDSRALSATYPPERTRARDSSTQMRPDRTLLQRPRSSASPCRGPGSGEEGGRFCSPATSTDHEMDALDRTSPNDPTSSNSKVSRWMVSSDGQTVIQCPVCKQTVQPSDVKTHLLKEMSKLAKLNNNNHHPETIDSPSISMKEPSNYFHPKTNLTRDITSKSRYETYLRIRSNRESRLARIRNRRRRSHDQGTSTSVNKSSRTPSVRHDDDDDDYEEEEGEEDAEEGDGRISRKQKDGLDDEPIDVISIEEQDKEEVTADWQMEATVDITTSTDGDADQTVKLTEGKETRADDCSVARGNSPVSCSSSHRCNRQTKDNALCSQCMQSYNRPFTSVQCWHVHCEDCWLQALTNKSSCPQCDVATIPEDLRMIYI